jgi:spermidine synthase
MKHALAVLMVFCVMGTLAAQHIAVSPGRERILELRRSPYAQVRVVEEDGVRSLYLGSRLQSSWEVARPDDIAFLYVKLMGAALTAWPGMEKGLPARMLLIGLGGGSLCRHVAKYYPAYRIEAVELDPVVHECAVKYFGLSPKVGVHIADGRAFLSEVRRMYDIILLDAFGEDYIPRELVTREFFQLVKSRLSPGGLLIANTHMDVGSDEHERRTYHAVFGRYCELANPEQSGNRIILCGRDGLPDAASLKTRMARAGSALGIREFDIMELLRCLYGVDAVPDGEVLTDANVHRLMKRR